MSSTSYNPRTGQTVAEHPATSAEQVDAVIRAATTAAPCVAATEPTRRQSWLNAIADALESNRDELAALADQETALGLLRLKHEVARTASQLRFYGDVAVEGSYAALTVDPATEVTQRLVRVNRPVGPVAIFGASNFPFAFSVLGNDTGAALAAGCPVVVKAHDAHLGLSLRQAELARDALERAGAPSGVFDMVVGFDAGASLVRAAGIAAVAFTGSQSGGLALWKAANERETVIPVFAEMGTVNPVVVTRAAAHRMPLIASGFVGSFTLGHGQFCTKPGLMFAPAGTNAANVVASSIEELAPTPVMLTEAIASGVVRGVEQLSEAGAEVVTTVSASEAGWAAPAVVLRATPDAFKTGSRLLEECFGPVAVVCEYETDEELDALLATIQPSLVASLMVENEADPQGADLLRTLSGKVGRVAVNDWPTGVAFNWAQHHGGPWPATSVPWATSVGAGALSRFVRPVAYQSTPDRWLPAEARSDNPWGLPRRVAGRLVNPK